MANRQRYDSKRVFRRKPGGPWYAWIYEVDAGGIRRRTRFSTGQLDKQAAIAVLVARERAAAQAPDGLAKDASGRTVADALGYLLEFSQTREWPTTTLKMFAQKSGHLNRVLRSCMSCAPMKPWLCTHESIQLVQLGPAVKKYIDVRLAEGAARESVRKELTTLRTALREAVALGWMSKAQSVDVIPDFTTQYTPRTRWLTRDEYVKLLDALDMVVMRAGKVVGNGTRKREVDETRASKRPRKLNRRLWVAIAVGLGARRSEVEALDWGDINLAAGVVANHGTKTKGSDRATPIPAELRTELLRTPDSARVGKVVGRWPSVGRDLPNACAIARIAKATPNDLRRTYASWLVNAGAPLKVVASLLGHNSTRMVDLVYGHVADETQVAWVAKLAMPSKSLAVDDRCLEPWDAYGTNVPKNPGAGDAPDAQAPIVSAAESAASPTRKPTKRVPRDGIEPPTRGFSVRCSTS
jgi:integrase